jgi:hypothetical protein
MKSRRTFLMPLSCAAVALGVVVLPALAEDLFGRITAVDVPAKKVTVDPKGEEKDVVVTVKDDTVIEAGKKGEERKLSLDELKADVEKSERGLFGVVTHEDNAASKIRVFGKGDFPRKGEFRGKGGRRGRGDHHGRGHKDGGPDEGERKDDGPRPEPKKGEQPKA